jgi:hypothetical protein
MILLDHAANTPIRLAPLKPLPLFEPGVQQRRGRPVIERRERLILEPLRPSQSPGEPDDPLR